MPAATPAAATPAVRGSDQHRRARQREDSRFIGRAQNTLAAVRGLYGLFALITGILAVLAWGGYMDREDRDALQFLAITLITMMAGLNVAGFVCFAANPFLWTVVLAALQTLNLILQAATIETWSGFAIAIVTLQALLVVALWCSVPVTVRFTKIQRERAAQARQAGKAAALSARVEERQAHEQRQAVRTFAFSAGAIAVLAVLAAWLPYRASAARRAEAIESSKQAQIEWQARAEQAAADKKRRAAERDAHADELEGTAASFRTDWGASNLEKVKSYFEAERQQTFWPKVVNLLERRGWQEKLPPLGKAEVSDEGDAGFEVFYQVDEEILKTRWNWIDGKWRIVRFAFSKL